MAKISQQKTLDRRLSLIEELLQRQIITDCQGEILDAAARIEAGLLDFNTIVTEFTGT